MNQCEFQANVTNLHMKHEPCNFLNLLSYIFINTGRFPIQQAKERVKEPSLRLNTASTIHRTLYINPLYFEVIPQLNQR